MQRVPAPVKAEAQAPSRQSPVVVLTDSLEKPSLDDRDYRVVRLENELEALLVHDPETDKASAALDVNVGNFSDEDGMPGMAHAVEHVSRVPCSCCFLLDLIEFARFLLLYCNCRILPIVLLASKHLGANTGVVVALVHGHEKVPYRE